MNMNNRRLVWRRVRVVMGLVALVAGSAFAANPQLTWTGSGDGSTWNDAANWNTTPDWTVANDLDFSSVAGGATLVNDATTTFGTLTFGANKGTVTISSTKTVQPVGAALVIPTGTTLDAKFPVGGWGSWGGWDIVVRGGGTLIIDGQLFGTYVGGKLTLDGVTAQMKTGMSCNGAGELILKGGAHLSTAANFNLYSLTSESSSDTFDLGGKSLELKQARGTFKGTLVGAGVIITRGSETWTLAGDSPNFSGRFEVNEGNVNVTGSLGPNVTIENRETGTFTVANDLSVAAVTPRPGISSIAAAGGIALAEGKTLTVTGGGTYRSRLSGTGTLALAAAGKTLTLSGANTHTGTLDIRAGTLVAADSDKAAFSGYPEGLVSRYSFDGELTTDDLGVNDLVVAAGAPTQMTNGLGGSRCVRFDGASRMETVANSFIEGKTPFTIAFWVRTTSTDTWTAGGTFLNVGQWSSAGNMEVSLGATSADGYGVGVLMTLCGNWWWQGNWQNGNWRHYALTFDGNTVRPYANGTLSEDSAKTRDWNIVKTKIKLGNKVVADYDEMLVFSRALTADEVQSLYRNPFPQPAAEAGTEPSPVAHWAFDDADNPGKDTSDNGFDLTVCGGTLNGVTDAATYGRAVRFTPGSGYLKYDGTGLSTGFPSGNASFTVNIRVANWSATGDFDLFSMGDVTQTGKSFRIGNGNYPKQLGYSKLPSGGINPLISGVPGSGYVVFTFVHDADAGTMTCYRDAVKVHGPAAVTTDIDAQGTVYLGYNPANPNGRTESKLDDVQVFAAALSAAQVRRLVQSLETGTVPGPLSGSSVVVREGATFRTALASPANVACLSGAGDVLVEANGLLATAGVSNFTGTVFGPGAFALAEGCTFDCLPDTPAIDVTGTLSLPSVATVRFAESAQGIAPVCLVARATSLTGVTDLSGWTCQMGGQTGRTIQATLRIKDNAVYAMRQGLVILIR